MSQIADSINNARLASEVELHSTTIRNEAAYFGCILRVRLKDREGILIITREGTTF